MEAIAPLRNEPAEQQLFARDDDDEEGSETEEYSSEDCKDQGEENDDPSYNPIEETQSMFSNMSLKKTGRRLSNKEDAQSGDDAEDTTKFDPKDEKNYEKVENMIKDGQLEKLKVDQCKLYLRKHGLRLTGKKDVLMARVREHLEIADGGGEKKYPTSSFIINCQGDACMGDIVIFEQNVYEMFSIASRSATGPPCGTRTVAGRIVKESYGAAKQQHTFTIEVLWSKGEKPLPPLHPLLIKGRNLYRLKTMRQRWPNEEERKRVLQEKHMRGSTARFSREVRIKKKESRKLSCKKREGEDHGMNTIDHYIKAKQPAMQNPQAKDTLLSSKKDNENGPLVMRPQPVAGNHYNNIDQVSTLQSNLTSQLLIKRDIQPWQHNSGKGSGNRQPLKDFNHSQKPEACAVQHRSFGNGCHLYNKKQEAGILGPPRFNTRQPCGRLNSPSDCHGNGPNNRPSMAGSVKQQSAGNLCSPPHSPRYGNNGQPTVCMNKQTIGNPRSPPHSPRYGNNFRQPVQRQYCRYYPMGRCYYMDNCKFLHQ